jgi:hypothetical protein
MKTERDLRIVRVMSLLVAVWLVGRPAQAKYGGGTGEPNDPCLICAPEHLREIGLDPNSWDKHFKLIADLDMSPYQGQSESETLTPIGLDTQHAFAGHFDGSGHTISNLTIRGVGLNPIVGLFGVVEAPMKMKGDLLEPEAVEVIRDLGLIDPNIAGTSSWRGVGALVGSLGNGRISRCYVRRGTITGMGCVGGLVGTAMMRNMPAARALCDCHVQNVNVQGSTTVGGLIGEFSQGYIHNCWSTARVRGDQGVGGLVGACEMFWQGASLSMCWSGGTVEGGDETGGLVGMCAGPGSMAGCCSSAVVHGGFAAGGLVGTSLYGEIADCYAIGPVTGIFQVGGLVGVNHGTVSTCYAAGCVTADSQAGGLIGSSDAVEPYPDGLVSDSFWDVDISGQATSAGGAGKTTAEMQTQRTFTDAAWDFVSETPNGTEDIWWIDEGKDYPRLWWEAAGDPDTITGE